MKCTKFSLVKKKNIYIYINVTIKLTEEVATQKLDQFTNFTYGTYKKIITIEQTIIKPKPSFI
jgi:hypothetical protein